MIASDDAALSAADVINACSCVRYSVDLRALYAAGQDGVWLT
jgi:hypothetical protein